MGGRLWHQEPVDPCILCVLLGWHGSKTMARGPCLYLLVDGLGNRGTSHVYQGRHPHACQQTTEQMTLSR